MGKYPEDQSSMTLEEKVDYLMVQSAYIIVILKQLDRQHSEGASARPAGEESSSG